MKNNKNILALVIAVIAIIAVLWLLLKNKINNTAFNSVGNSATSTVISVSGSGVKLPDLDRKLVLPSEYSSIVKSKIEAGVLDSISKVKSDPNNTASWFKLALWYKMARDYTGAEEIWRYIISVEPDNRLAQSNLGDLYKNFLVNYEKSETAWLKVISLDPTYVDAYNELYMLYKYNMPTKKAEAPKMLLSGIEKTKSAMLMYQLAEYYRTIPNKTLAIDWYVKAKVAAKAIGDNNMIKSIDEALAKLK